MKKAQLNTVKGMRDFGPQKMLLREEIMEIIRRNFRSFGFLPLETPTLEGLDLLMEKYGDEGSKLIYNFEDRAGRPLGMIYDLTVPLSRYVAMNFNKLKLPFKRYQIQRVYRYDNPQRGRFREFYQCDIDVIGSASYLSDAEILIATTRILNELGLKDFKILINSRIFLNDFLKKFGIEGDEAVLFMTGIDKADKMGMDKVIIYLKEKGLSKEPAGIIKELTSAKDQVPESIASIKKYFSAFFDPSIIEFSPLLARGLSYYTDTVFEIILSGENMGTVAAGGRYDGLIENLLGLKVPACGISLGFERLYQILSEKGERARQAYDYMIMNSGNTMKELAVLKELTEAGYSTLYYPENVKLTKQFKYADTYGIKKAVILGDEEIEKDEIRIKDLADRSQISKKLKAFFKDIKEKGK
ncbi:histidine--tRNA ligase [bacterium]|nr:histidine--tRNA ligase [bacterium]